MTDLIYSPLYTVQGVLVKKRSDYVSVKCRSDSSFLNVLLYVRLKIEESIMDVSSSGWAVVYLLCRAVLVVHRKVKCVQLIKIKPSNLHIPPLFIPSFVAQTRDNVLKGNNTETGLGNEEAVFLSVIFSFINLCCLGC